MRELKINQCDFCRKQSNNKNQMISHERNCYNNPSNHGCPTCFWRIQKYGEESIRCHLDLIHISADGQPTRMKKRCHNWINYDQRYDLSQFFNDKRKA